MPAGDRARHRAPLRPHTPLSELGESLTQRAQTLGRTGAILAMSSGLVSTLGLPAHGATRPTPATSGAPVDHDRSASADHTAAIAAAVAQRAPLTAAADSKITFDTSSRTSGLTATKAPEPEPATERTSTRVSRSTTSRSSTSQSSTSQGSTGSSSVLAVAARYVGIPYVYGGTSPSGFDCSGYVRYVFAQLGYSLPRTANQQLNATRRISRSEARPGDIVFFISGGRAYHDGIYAGNGMMYDSPRPGKSIQRRAIWSSNVVFGRVIG
ncbi:MAG: C40 family peptidase [Actinomycetales bacterium]|nr:C40 family peptidase [Actinomycetales bacterium]